MRRSGTADLPLHGGRVPAWLASRMTIGVLRRGLEAARLGHSDKLDGMKRLDRFVRAIEDHYTPEADFHAALAHERAISPSLGGRTVFDKPRAAKSRQLSLFEREGS
ncbi:MAG: hypothetical protein ABI051_10940 [Vicinamibacterales bacterium]